MRSDTPNPFRVGDRVRPVHRHPRRRVGEVAHRPQWPDQVSVRWEGLKGHRTFHVKELVKA